MRAEEAGVLLTRGIQQGLVHPNEPVFILRGQDLLAADTVMHWAFLAKRTHGKVPKPKIDGAIDVATAMHEWPKRRMPD